MTGRKCKGHLHVDKKFNIQYIYDEIDSTDSREGVPQQAGVAVQHNITEAAANELNLGEVG